MGKKYIIEIPEDKIEDFVGSTHFLMPYMMAGHIGHHDTGLPIEPYTEPDLEQARKEAYDKGLNDAWEAARKIACDEGIDMNTLCTIFRRGSSVSIIRDYSASEAIAKIKEYEQEKEEQDGLRQNIQTIVDQCGYTLDEIAAVLEKMRGEQE